MTDTEKLIAELEAFIRSTNLPYPYAIEANAKLAKAIGALREIKDQYLAPDQSSAIARAALLGLYEFNAKHQPDLIDTRVMRIARAALAPEQNK